MRSSFFFSLSLIVLVAGCAHYEPKPLAPAVTAAAFTQRSLTNAALREFLAVNQLPPETWPLRTWNFEQLTLAALYYSPSLALSRADLELALAGKSTASARPNPTVTATPGYNFSAASGVSPWIPGITFDLPVETAGKRGYRIARAQWLAESARWKLATAAWQVRSQVRTALLEMQLARDQQQLLQRSASVQEKLVKVLTERLQAGALAASDLALPHATLDRLKFDSLEAQRLARLARAKLADLVGVPVQALESWPITPPEEPETLDLKTESILRAAALLGRSDLRAALADYEASQSALQLEIARQYPDLRLGSGYQWDGGDHKWTLSASLELPLLNQNQGPIAEARAKREQAAAQFLALQAKVNSDLDIAAANLSAAREQLRQAEALAEAQRQRSRQVAASRAAGAADALDEASMEVELAANQSLILDARQRIRLARGQLEDALQRPFAGLSQLSSLPPVTQASAPHP